MDDKGFRRSRNVEDRRKEKLPRGPFGTPGLPPNIFEGGGTMEKLDSKDMPPVQRTKAGKALGLDELERDALTQEQNGQVRDALDNSPVAVPGQDDPNGPPVRINNRQATANPVPFMGGPANETVQDAIRRAAREEGISEEAALAYADRESKFNPYARNSKTIFGMYQMQKKWRDQYGSGESVDPYTQAKGWARFYKANKAEMASVLGRDPTDSEAYLGHHFGGTRAAHMMGMPTDTPVQLLFTPEERRLNPHIDKAGTTGTLQTALVSDMDRRMSKYGSGEPMDFSAQVGLQPASDQTAGPRTRVAGDNVGASGPDYQANFDRNKKWAKQGNYRTDLGDQEGAFRKWAQDNKVPFDVNRTGPDDYDMRGFYKGLQTGDPRATMVPNANDGKVHYDDKWKTPYHNSFSSESQWAQPNAPKWNEKDQLIDPANGSVVFDEKAKAAPDLDFSSQVGSPPTAPATKGAEPLDFTSQVQMQ